MNQYLLINLPSSRCLAKLAGISHMTLEYCSKPATLGKTIVWNITFNNDSNSTWTIFSASNQTLATMIGNVVSVQPFSGGPNQKWQFYILPTPVGRPSVWSPPIQLPIIAIAAAHVSDGRILFWSAAKADDIAGYQPGITYTAFYTPSTGEVSPIIIANINANMFCPGTVKLHDGRIFLAGGVTSKATSIFNGSSWTPSQQLKIARGYNSAVTLSDGNVFTLGGSWSGSLGGKTGELWNETTGWRLLANVRPEPDFNTKDTGGLYRRDNHMWLFAASGGWVFHAGPSRAMYWVQTAGNGTVLSAGVRGNDGDAMNGNAVMYDAVAGRILTIGGGPNYHSLATTNAFIIDVSAGPGANATVRQTGSMNRRRQFCTSVVLPNGEVVVVGGQSTGSSFDDSNAQLSAEVWSPDSERFSLLSWATGATPMVTPRVYHSVLLLLHDGRVFSSGGNGCGTCPFNHLDAQIITPPYLLNADGSPATRPTLFSAPTAARLGETALVTATGARSFALMRMSTTTHAIDTDQRRIPLAGTPMTVTPDSEAGPSNDTSAVASPDTTSAAADSDTAAAVVYSVTIPADPGVAVPGDYMLFALGPTGTPSTSLAISIRSRDA
jgi:galactose oxidase